MSECVLAAADVRPAAEPRPGLYIGEYPYIDAYTERGFGVWLDITDERGFESLLGYLGELLRRTETAELWKVWLGNEYCWDLDFDERPIRRRRAARLAGLTAEDLRELFDAPVWPSPGTGRPVFYCLTVTR